MYSKKIKKIINYFKNKSIKEKNQLRKHKVYNQIVDETNFLNANVSINQRFLHVLNNTKEIPKCLECDNYVTWSAKNKYNIYCSKYCSNNSNNVKQKKIKSYLNIYKVSNPSQSKIIKKKKIKTCLKNYGVKNPLQSKKIKEKMKQTCFNKYGVNNYNHKNLFKTSVNKLKNKNWLKYQHHTLKKSLTLISKELGFANNTSLSRYFKKYRIPVFIQSSSILENELLEYVKLIYFNKIITNSRNVINPYELDIYLPEDKLAIEFNGLYWHSSKIKDNVYHINKTLDCLKKNINLIHIFEDEWLNNTSVIKLKLKQVLNLLPILKINQTKIIEVNEYTTILEYQNEKVAEMKFKFENNKVILKEYNTFNFIVQNSFKHLLNYNINKYNLKEIYSYVDFNWPTNIIDYKNNNFKFIKYIPNNKLRTLNTNYQFNIYDAGKIVYMFTN